MTRSRPQPSPVGKRAPVGPETAQVITMLRWLLYVVFAVLAWFALRYVASIVGPVLVAFGVAYLTSPILEWLVRRGLSRGLGALLIIVTLIGVVVGIVLFVVPRAGHQFSVFADKIPQLLADAIHWVETTFGVELPASWREALSDNRLEGVMGGAGPVGQLAVAAVSGVIAVIATLVEVLMVLIFTYYFLVDFPNIQSRVVGLIPPRRRAAAVDLLREIDRVVAGWVRGQAVVVGILSVLYALGFSLVGMNMAIPIGLTVGLLPVIPFIGAVIGAVLALGLALADGSSASVLIGIAVVLVVLHVLEAAVLTPKIVGHKVGLSESAALFAVFAGGKVLGFVGILLAVPIAATLAVLLRHGVRAYEKTEFFGEEADAEVKVTDAMALIVPTKLEAETVTAHEVPPPVLADLEPAPETSSATSSEPVSVTVTATETVTVTVTKEDPPA